VRRVHRGAFASEVLRSDLNQLADGRDRALTTDLVYGTLRWHRFLEAALAPLLRAPDRLPERVLAALWLGAYERLIRGTPAHAAVNSWVALVADGHPRLRGLTNAVLRRVALPAHLDPATALALPPWLLSAFETALGDRAERAAKGMLEPEPLWLTALHPEAPELLRSEGCEVTQGPVPGSYAVRPSRPLARLSAFARGWVQPQNPSSALVGALLEPRPGERVLDLASGRGIKAAQLAAAGAAVTGVELERGRIDSARSNLNRLGLAVDHVRADLGRPDQRPRLAPAMKVLLDAPCSGTGTLRGHPEIKLRLTSEAVADLADLQRRMLDTAATLTSSGGTLLYAVCALTPEEGDRQIAAFLERTPGFAAAPLDLPIEAVGSGPGRYLLPVAGCDGFYVARLQRS
jgi:16S rRNA (cytosine967-C5)-methyltransferase